MEEALKKAAAANDEASFAAARATARAHGGATALRAHLLAAGHIDEDGMLTTGVKPFNVFARVASGKMSQPNMEEENAALGAAYAERFVVASNLPAADKDWASTAPEQIGKVSMGERHRFLTTRNLSWEWFNVLAFGLEGDATSLREAIATLEAMQAAARAFAKGTPKWSESPERLGMFFHCFPNNSVQGLHMHLVDLGATGPTFDHFSYKNLPATAVLKVLRDEREAEAASRAVAESADASAEPVQPVNLFQRLLRRVSTLGQAEPAAEEAGVQEEDGGEEDEEGEEGEDGEEEGEEEGEEGKDGEEEGEGG